MADDPTTLCLAIFVVSAAYATGMLAILCLSSDSKFLNSLLIASPAMLLMAAYCLEVVAFSSGVFLIAVLLLSRIADARIPLRFLHSGQETANSRNGFSLQSVLIATLFVAAILAVIRDAALRSVGLYWTAFMAGSLSGVAFGLGFYVVDGKTRLEWRVVFATVGLLASSIALGMNNGFLEDATHLVAAREWELPDPSDQSLWNWGGALFAVFSLAMVSAMLAQRSRVKSRSAAPVGLLMFIVSVPALFALFHILGSEGQSPVITDYGNVDIHSKFADELIDETFDLTLDPCELASFVYPSTLGYELDDFKYQEAASRIAPGAQPSDIKGNSLGWETYAQSVFLNCQLVAHARFDTARKKGYRSIEQGMSQSASILEEQVDQALGYRDTRTMELQGIAEQFSWRGELYVALLTASGREYLHVMSEFDKYLRTYRMLLLADLEVRKRLYKSDEDATGILKAVAESYRDPYDLEKPLRFVLRDGDFLIYSVGFDGQDDEAVPCTSITGTGDIVLPTESEVDDAINNIPKK